MAGLALVLGYYRQRAQTASERRLTMSVQAQAIRRPARNRFYFYALLGAATVLFAGFAQTYFLKVFFATPSLYPLLHVHGFVMTAWFLLFGAQTWLVEARRTDLHRRLGVVGAILSIMIVVFGAIVVTINTREGRVPDAAAAPVIVLLSYANIFIFGAFVATAVCLRRRPEAHKRLMLLATLNLLSAAFSRIPLDFIQSGGVFAVFGLLDLFVLLCVAYDTWRHRRLHPAFAWGALVTFVWPALSIAAAGTTAWGRVVAPLIGK
jgi:hypothetical protein